MKKLILLAMTLPMMAQETRLLWPGGAPGALGEADADKPSLTIYLPAKGTANGAGVLICPGGGYGHLALDHEGKQIAEWLNARGMAGFILKYRLGPRYRHPIEIGDAKRALRLVRANAAEFGVAPDRIGAWGFSAGGHLASTLGTHFDAGDAAAADPIDRVSSRPSFLILSYPVITLEDPYTHKGSRTNLLGENPDPALVRSLSNETQVTPDTPPTFLFHTDADRAVATENSVRFYLALRRVGVPAEMHIYLLGRHGVGLAQKDPVLSSWPDRLADWLRNFSHSAEASR
jgi:acetyl esterase/lipase